MSCKVIVSTGHLFITRISVSSACVSTLLLTGRFAIYIEDSKLDPEHILRELLFYCEQASATWCTCSIVDCWLLNPNWWSGIRLLSTMECLNVLANSFSWSCTYWQKTYRSIRHLLIWWFPWFVNECVVGHFPVFRKLFQSQCIQICVTMTIPFQVSSFIMWSVMRLSRADG